MTTCTCGHTQADHFGFTTDHCRQPGCKCEHYATHGGKRTGAGRPVGTVKPDSRNNRLMQRYSDAELAGLTAAAKRQGFSTISEYIRSVVL